MKDTIKFSVKILIVLLVAVVSIQASNGAFTWIGKVKLLDTLNGNLKLNHGLWLSNDSLNGVSKVNTTDLQSGAGIKFASTDTYIDDDGFDLRYEVPASGQHYFDINGMDKLGISSTGLTIFTPTDSLRINAATTAGTVDAAEGIITVYVNGQVRYIQLFKTIP